MPLHTIRCAVCEHPFDAARRDAAICSPACRQRRTRAAAKVRAERDRAAIERAADALAALRAAAALTPDD